ncbi:hypothetical protein O3M35_008372 [Rhynocoris fuscipes]|uniref:thioredoxin-dependent peroxiredoxin n=1 Tax=Rhynocoris fuscipes TaxID=488301 RepID=A0AAW1D625_9HEMI
MSSELIGELGQVGLTIGQGPVSNNSSTTVSNSNDENSPERKRQNVNVRPYNQSSRPVNRKRFRTAWLMFDIFKDWLRPHPSPELANCIVCNRVIKAGKSELEKHAAGKRHLTMLKEMNSSGNTGAADTRYARGEVVVLHEEMVGVQEFDSAYDESGGAVSVSSGGESSYKEDYDRKFGDSNKGTTGAAGGTGGAQSVDNSEGNYTTGIYTPQQRNVGPPVQMVTKAVVMNPAPNWKATAIVNGHVTRLDLSDYVGRYLVLVFYPQDFSKICASEINALSDRSYEFRSIQTEIVACSVDSHLAHLTWSKISRADGGVNLPKIPLIADPTHTIAKAYGVLLPDKGHTLRAHFIIDKRGILRHMSVTDTLVGRGTDELFRLVKALQYVDEVEEPVPADWNQQNE